MTNLPSSSLIALAVALGACTAPDRPRSTLGGLECIATTNSLYQENIPATHAVHLEFDGPPPEVDPVPDEQQWDEGWILASPAGGLWLGYSPPDEEVFSGLTLAMNDVSRRESVFGSLSNTSYPAALRGLTEGSGEAAAALACAAVQGPR